MLLEVRGLSVKIGKKQIVDGVSFGVEAGENVAVIGANGAGKTTMLRAIAGLNDYSGSIFADGEEMRSVTPLMRARKISYVPQGGAVDGGEVEEAALVEVIVYFLLHRHGRSPFAGLAGLRRTAVCPLTLAANRPF